MPYSICPNTGWKYTFQDYTGDEPIIKDDVLLASIENDDFVVKFQSDKMEKDFEVWIYYEEEEGISTSTENKAVQHLKVTSPPSYFETFELFFEDCNGVRATYGLLDVAVGKENQIDLKSMVKGEDFNDSFITKIGYHIKAPKSERKFTLFLYELRLTYLENPSYCTPQEVMDFLMLVDNKGEAYKVTESSIPSYNTIAKRIVEAEAYIESVTRHAFVERRVENEIGNMESARGGMPGYLGIYGAHGFGMWGGSNPLFKGIPVKLTRNRILPIDYSKGDKVEVRRYGTLWSTVPNDTVWEDPIKGIIFVKTLFFQKDDSIRVTYRHGYGPIPPDIKRACLLKTAMLILQTEWYIAKFPQSPDITQLRETTLNSWTWELKDLLRPYSNYLSHGGF